MKTRKINEDDREMIKEIIWNTILEFASLTPDIAEAATSRIVCYLEDEGVI